MRKVAKRLLELLNKLHTELKALAQAVHSIKR